VNLSGLPYERNIFSGREICRKTLLDGLYVFGSPTSILIRSDYIRKNKQIFDESSVHADKEVCFEFLKYSDFGFVHQILTFTRRHNESVTSANKKLNTHKIGKLVIFFKYGPVFLDKNEYEKRLKKILKNYYRFLSRSILGLKGKEFWAYQKEELAKIGLSISYKRILKSLFFELLNLRDSINRLRLAKNKKQKYKYAQRL
jgi:hypothetical protein